MHITTWKGIYKRLAWGKQCAASLEYPVRVSRYHYNKISNDAHSIIDFFGEFINFTLYNFRGLSRQRQVGSETH